MNYSKTTVYLIQMTLKGCELLSFGDVCLLTNIMKPDGSCGIQSAKCRKKSLVKVTQHNPQTFLEFEQLHLGIIFFLYHCLEGSVHPLKQGKLVPCARLQLTQQGRH